MSSTILGFGASAFGASSLAFGTPATSDAPGVPAIGEGRYIDPVTRDYAIDTVTPGSTGSLKRQSSVQQLVYLALLTVRNSSSVQNLGLDRLPDRITATMQSDIQAAVVRALDHILSKGLASLISVDVVRARAPASRLEVRIRWKDLTTDTEHLNTL